MSRPLFLFLLVACGTAFEWPFKLPWVVSTSPDQLVFEGPADTTTRVVRPPRVAIIGAGAGGSSAAYWLSLSRTRANLTFDIDVYERSDYIGGRESPCVRWANVSCLPASCREYDRVPVRKRRVSTHRGAL